MQSFSITKETLPEFVETFLAELPALAGASAGVMGLSGNLGAGKTTFVQHLARALGITENITSPTFVIEKRYTINRKNFPFDTLIHIDAYRLSGGSELIRLRFEEDLSRPENLIVIEWPEHVSDILPSNMTMISFEVLDEKTRSITINGNENKTKK